MTTALPSFLCTVGEEAYFPAHAVLSMPVVGFTVVSVSEHKIRTRTVAPLRKPLHRLLSEARHSSPLSPTTGKAGCHFETPVTPRFQAGSLSPFWHLNGCRPSPLLRLHYSEDVLMMQVVVLTGDRSLACRPMLDTCGSVGHRCCRSVAYQSI